MRKILLIVLSTCVLGCGHEEITPPVPSGLALMSTTFIDGQPRSFVIHNNHAYVATGARGLVVLDLNDPSEPSVVNQIDGLSRHVAVTNGHLYSAGQTLKIYELEDPRTPSLVGEALVTNFNILSVCAEGNQVYVAVGIRGLRILDMSTPSQPEVVGSIASLGNVRNVRVSDGQAYLGTGGAGDLSLRHLLVLDVGDSSRPRLLGVLQILYDELSVQGSSIFVTGAGRGLRVVDAHNPASMNIVGDQDLVGPELLVHCIEEILYIVTATHLVRFEIGEAVSPSFLNQTALGTLFAPFSGGGMQVDSRSVFVLLQGGLQVFSKVGDL